MNDGRSRYSVASVDNSPANPPQSRRHRKRIDSYRLPPRQFVPDLVVFSMVSSAQRNYVFIARFASQSPRLSKSKMMRVGRGTPAKQTGLQANKLQMGLVSIATGLG